MQRDCGVVERGVAVVDARGEVVVAADAEAGERDVGGGDAELLARARSEQFPMNVWRVVGWTGIPPCCLARSL